MPELLQVCNLSVQFATPEGRVTAVRDVSFEIASGETFGLVGESGSGKSVTSLAILRLLAPQATVSGSIRFRDEELLAFDSVAMRRVRGAQISMIFQEPMTALNPVMRVGDQIAEAVMAHADRAGEKALDEKEAYSAHLKARPFQDQIDDPSSRERASSKPTKADAWRRAIEALRTVSIPDPERRARDYPHQLSGGQRQRVMIAMAVVNRPQLLIADEPTTALDVTIQAQVLDLLNQLRHRFSLAMLFISHDLAVISQISDRVGVMYAGSLVEVGSARQVFAEAVHPYSRGLLQSVPTLHSDRSQPLRTIEGTVPALSALPPGCSFEPRCGSRIADCVTALPPLVEVAPGHLARCPVTAAEVR